MLSRTLLTGHQSRALLALGTRVISTTSPTLSGSKTEDLPEFRRPVRQQPGKVRLGFVPEEWFTYFHKKTGVTGPYTLAFTLSTYLVSKEIYVLEHEFYSGLSLLIIYVAGVKLLGPKVAASLDKEIDEYEASWNKGRDEEKEMLAKQIEQEKKLQFSQEGQNLLLQAKRENVALQLEADYRQRLVNAFNEVKKRLDYQVEKQNIERRINQRNIVDWVVRKVRASITPDQEKQNINKCIADLAVLAK